MDRENLPTPNFTRDEMLHLQELVNTNRAACFNFYISALETGAPDVDKLFDKYQNARAIRDKVYHMTGRDTLAPIGIHEQRWWDQQHDYVK